MSFDKATEIMMEINTAVKELVRQPAKFHWAMSHIERQFRELRTYLFLNPYHHQMLWIRLLQCLRRFALEEGPNQLLENPNFWTRLFALPGIEQVVNNPHSLEKTLKRVKSEWEDDLEGEMEYVVEVEFFKKLSKTLNEMHRVEKKRRFSIFHEELIAKTWHPARISRLASLAGKDEIDFLEAYA